MKRLKTIAVFGGSRCSEQEYEISRAMGQILARENIAIICGGGSGIMEAVCRGAREEEGLTIGILPGNDPSEANDFIKIPIATGMGIARNSIIVRSAPVCLALFGAYGTLSEIAYGLQLGKPVVCMGRWSEIEGVIPATNLQQAIREIQNRI